MPDICTFTPIDQIPSSGTTMIDETERNKGGGCGMDAPRLTAKFIWVQR